MQKTMTVDGSNGTGSDIDAIRDVLNGLVGGTLSPAFVEEILAQHIEAVGVSAIYGSPSNAGSTSSRTARDGSDGEFDIAA